MPGTSPQGPLDRPTATAAGGPAAGNAAVPGPRRSTGRVGALGFCLAWLAIALGVGVAVGLIVGLVTRVLADSSNGWADLAAVILGMIAGVIAAMLLWFVAMVLATRRFVPAGRRLGVLGWSALIVVASPVLVAALFTLVGSPSLPRGVVILTALLAMVLAPVGFVAARVPVADAPASAVGGSMAG